MGVGSPSLVTGATGFLGQHLVARLRGQGPLRVLARGPSPWDEAADVEVVRGDVTVSADVDRAVAGVGRVYNLAGDVSRDRRDKWRLLATHVEGTRNVCRAALSQGVERIVHVSSSGTIAVDRSPIVHDERSIYRPELLADWPYYLAKLYGETQARSYVADGLPLVVVNPSLLLGPGGRPGSSTRDVESFLRGQVPVVPPGGLNFVDVRDVAAGLIAAMVHGRVGERYLLGGPNWTFRRFFDALAGLAGRSRPAFLAPTPLIRAGAGLLRRVAPLVGASYDVDDASIQMSGFFWYCDSTRARAELGFETRDPIETLRETVADLRQRRERVPLPSG